MNLKAILVFCGSALSLAAEATSNHRKWLISFLIAALVTSFIPILVSLTEFCLSPRSKWRRFKYAVLQLFLDEYFPLLETRRRLQGRSVYCHQGHGTTVHCLHDTHLVVAPQPGTPASNIIDIPTDTVKNLKLSFLNKDSAYKAFHGWSAEFSLRDEGLSVLMESESEQGYTYDVDVRLADEAGDRIFTELQNEHVLMEVEIDVGDLNIFFRFDRDGVFVPKCGNGGASTTSITFKIKGNPEPECVLRSQWGFREARRFMAYLAYWKQRDCCGVLLTSPFPRGYVHPAIVLNVCTVQDLIDVAESHAPLTRFRAIHHCITEGQSFWTTEQKASRIAKAAARRAKVEHHPPANKVFSCV